MTFGDSKRKLISIERLRNVPGRFLADDKNLLQTSSTCWHGVRQRCKTLPVGNKHQQVSCLSLPPRGGNVVYDGTFPVCSAEVYVFQPRPTARPPARLPVTTAGTRRSSRGGMRKARLSCTFIASARRCGRGRHHSPCPRSHACCMQVLSLCLLELPRPARLAIVFASEDKDEMTRTQPRMALEARIRASICW